MKYLSSRTFSLMTLAGVADAHLDGDFIVGHWAPNLGYIAWAPELGYIVNNQPLQGSIGSIVEDFVNVNSSEPERILRFTLKYGPLSKPKAGAEFRESLKDWRADQKWFQRKWSSGSSLSYQSGMHVGEQVHFDRDGVRAIELDSLKRFMEFEIFSSPSALRRICARPECGTYFIATRKDSRLCGTPLCADFVRKQHMLNWWREHGDEWRARRKKKMKKRRKP